MSKERVKERQEILSKRAEEEAEAYRSVVDEGMDQITDSMMSTLELILKFDDYRVRQVLAEWAVFLILRGSELTRFGQIGILGSLFSRLVEPRTGVIEMILGRDEHDS